MKSKSFYTIGCMVIVYPIYAKIPSFVGDLVARDLGGAGPVGHVGIATAPNYKLRPSSVLEAMDSAPHIQENTIENFKSRTTYWGSKGGLLTPQSIESYIVANRIVRQYFACPEYSYTWRWKEGEIGANGHPISCALFRCDTLVNYAYAFDEGYSLPTYDTMWTNPLAIFNYFPVDSDLFLPEHTINPSVSQNETNETMDSINENNIKELTNDNFNVILQNTKHISKEQIIYLWKLFTSNEIDNGIKVLFFDFISFEAPDYLTSNIIKQAKSENGEVRHKLLVALQSIYQSKLKNSETTNLKEIISYFRELQLQNLSKNDAGIVYRGIVTLAPKYLDYKRANLTNMDKIHVDILSMRGHSSKELEYVKDIICNLDHPDDNLVITASYQYLTQLLIKSDLNFFSNESKELFKEHINSRPLISYNESMVYTSAIIEFKATLNASKIDEIPTLVYNYLQLIEPESRKSAFFGFTDFTRDRLKNIVNY